MFLCTVNSNQVFRVLCSCLCHLLMDGGGPQLYHRAYHRCHSAICSCHLSPPSPSLALTIPSSLPKQNSIFLLATIPACTDSNAETFLSSFSCRRIFSLRREGVVVQRFVLPRVSESIVRSVTALQGYNNHISPFFNRMLRASSSLGMKNIYLEVLERIVGASLYVVLLTFDDRPHK
jgi:hypothetical protein